MGYSEALSKMVKDCGLSLREISERCKVIGQKVDPSYISKLQTGNQDPASEDVNRAISKVCGQDPEILLYEAYMQKAPVLIKSFHRKMLDYFKSMTLNLMTQQLDLDTKALIENEITSLSDVELLRIIDQQNLIPPAIEKGDMFLIDNPLPGGKDTQVLLSPLISFKIADDSMEPIIPKGSKIQLDQAVKNVSKGDLVAVVLKDKSSYIRRYVPVDNKIALIAENRNYETLVFDANEINIVGRVKSYTKEF